MKITALIAGLLALFITLPIWFYLIYQILIMIHATELMWFLYWVYIPATVFVSIIARLAKE